MKPSKVVAAISTPGTQGTGSAQFSPLPGDILSQSCRRVGLAAAVFASLWLFSLFMNNVVARLAGEAMADIAIGGEQWPLAVRNVIAVIGVVISVGMAFVAGRLHAKPEVLLNVGLGFMVVTAFLVGLVHRWVPPTDAFGLSWIVMVILVYPTIAPNTPGRILAASFVAASMDPLALGITALRGVEIALNPFQLIWLFIPVYISAALAVLPAHIIRGLSRQVRKARELGSYRLGEVLGRGGMGEVHRATHRMLARPAAIKLIRPEVLGASSNAARRVIVERFKREAQAAATLRSPHTIELYDFGVTEDGTFYYVMEMLDGMDLETMVQRFGPQPTERTVHLLRQTSWSLGEAHSRGLIHRDIKPSNIHASRMGLLVDFVKVLDFGLVKNDPTRGQDQTNLTAPQVTTGTPAFMAPEVALGEAVDRRADVYALGCVGYWLLTGQLVFDAENSLKMMHRHISETPVPPSRRTELDVPVDLDQLILACLAKDPDARPADGEEVAGRLGAIEPAEPWTQERARRWWNIHIPTCPEGEPCEERIIAPAAMVAAD